ncbi:rhamnogalacturonan acetylesterase [Massilia sp. SM-13]|uniref:rhamnogalacturonan acetylesterase n=1 Tax=Pseudoduganella rhizocola TaxID=3382643 RepID=UPI0038B5ED6D
MKRLSVAALALAMAGSAFAAAPDARPVRFILVGDSTMAHYSGYGDAFCAHVKRSNNCTNLAKGGRSSGSFRAEGRWDEVQGMLRGSAAYRATYVLIQFGHNDQPGKPGRSTDFVTEFPVNMARYVDEVRALGGVPVLVTPLTRRSFRPDGILKNDLAPWADVIRKTAASKNAPLLDLNTDSYNAVQAMGEAEADTLAVAPKPAAAPAAANSAAAEPQGAPKSEFDHTHTGPKGAAFFARMVMNEMKAAIPELTKEFQDVAQ